MIAFLVMWGYDAPEQRRHLQYGAPAAAGCYVASVRIGVYVDGFNLYYGGPGLCGRGAGRPWWARLNCADLTSHQLPDPAGKYRRPAGW